MLKRVGVLIGLLFLLSGELIAQPANAVGMQPGQVVTPWSGIAFTSPLTSQSYSIGIGPKGVPAITWQVITPSAPTSFTANLQASSDGTTYATIDSATAVGIRTVFGSYKFVRLTTSAVSGGTSPTLTAYLVYSTGNVATTSGGSIYAGGTFTGSITAPGATFTAPILLPNGTAATPSLAFSSGTNYGLYFDGSNINFSANGSRQFAMGGSGLFIFSNSQLLTGGSAFDVQLHRDAANILAMRNGTAAQTFNVYNTYTDASNYERGVLYWNANAFYLTTQRAGTGTLRGLYITSGSAITSFGSDGNTYWGISSDGFYPFTSDTHGLGRSNGQILQLFLSRSIQGSKSKALVDNTATAFATMAMPQTAGSNYGGGKGIYTIFCKDAANQAVETGEFHFACHNLAGTESCTIGTAGAPTVNVILGDGTASFVAPVFTAAAGADLVTFSVQSDCSGVTPTTHTIQVRFDMPQPNTLAFP